MKLLKEKLLNEYLKKYFISNDIDDLITQAFNAGWDAHIEAHRIIQEEENKKKNAIRFNFNNVKLEKILDNTIGRYF